MEAPGGGEDYRHAGWTFEVDRGEEFASFKLAVRSDERPQAPAPHRLESGGGRNRRPDLRAVVDEPS
jgi:hypothetical protein